VDDERTLRFTLKEGLSEEGYRVETAADCAEALEKLEREERSISDARASVIGVHDRLQQELKRRYREDPTLITH